MQVFFIIKQRLRSEGVEGDDGTPEMREMVVGGQM